MGRLFGNAFHDENYYHYEPMKCMLAEMDHHRPLFFF